MSSLIEHAQRFEVAQLEAILNEEPQCEGEMHGTHQWGHDDGPAKYLAAFPCGAPSVLACAGRAACFRALGCTCTKCGSIHGGAEIRLVEL